MTAKIDFTKATADEKEQLLGREFRNIHVISQWFHDGVCRTEILFNGDHLILIGDPTACLKTTLGGHQ